MASPAGQQVTQGGVEATAEDAVNTLLGPREPLGAAVPSNRCRQGSDGGETRWVGFGVKPCNLQPLLCSLCVPSTDTFGAPIWAS